MAVSNLIDGIDWYSISSLAFLSTTKLPAGTVLYPLSSLTYIEDGASVVLGSANGGAYILGRDKVVENLKPEGKGLPLCEGCSNYDSRRLRYHTISGM